MAMAKPDETAEVTGRSELPPLKGTQELVAWAETIRGKRLAQIDDAMRAARHGSMGNIPVKLLNSFWDAHDSATIMSLLSKEEQARFYGQIKGLGCDVDGVVKLTLSTRDSILSSERMQKAVAALKSNDSAEFWVDTKYERDSDLLVSAYRAAGPEIAAAKEELPPLRGTKKQVVQAEKVRSETLAKIDKASVELGVAADKRMQKAVDALKSNDSAEFWVDNGNVRVDAMLAAQYREIAPETMAEKDVLPPLRGTQELVAVAENVRALKLAGIDNILGAARHGGLEGRILYMYEGASNDILAVLPEKDRAKLNELYGVLGRALDDRDKLRPLVRDNILRSERMQKAVAALKSNDSAEFWVDNGDVRVSKMLANQYKAIKLDVNAEKDVPTPSRYAEDHALPPLHGTEKQLAWAERLRDVKLTQLDNALTNNLWDNKDTNVILSLLSETDQVKLSEICSKLQPEDRKELLMSVRDDFLNTERMQKAVNAVQYNDNAKFWIDNRNAMPSEMLANQYKALAKEEAQGKSVASPEQTRWVSATPYGEFAVKCGRDEKLYAEARKLPDARYNKQQQCVVVPGAAAKEVAAFAEENRFKFTRSAEALLAKSRNNAVSSQMER